MCSADVIRRCAVLLALGLTACPESSEPPPAIAAGAPLRFKRADRLVNDFARALELTREELCVEPDGASCAKANRVALGAAAPFTSAVYEEPEIEAINAPLVVDRIALAACRRRVDRDLGDQVNALIFVGIDSEAGKRQVIERLYKRAVQRVPTAEEVAVQLSLAEKVVASGEADPDRNWSILSCFTVLTGVESLFY